MINKHPFSIQLNRILHKLYLFLEKTNVILTSVQYQTLMVTTDIRTCVPSGTLHILYVMAIVEVPLATSFVIVWVTLSTQM